MKTINQLLVAGLLFTLAGCGSSDADRWHEAIQRIPEPSLDNLAEPAREQITEQHQQLMRLIDSPSASKLSVSNKLAQSGKLYLAYNFYLAAAAAFEEAYQIQPHQQSWLYLKGVALEFNGETEGAAQAYREYLKHEPDDLPAMIRLAEIEIISNRTDSASALLGRVFEQTQTHAAALAAAGRLALELGQADQAISYFKRALEQQPNATNLNYPLATALRQAGQSGEASKTLAQIGDRKVIMQDPLLQQIQALVVGAGSHIELARRAHESGDLPTAVSHLQAALRYEPDNSKALHNLGSIVGQAGDHRRSLEFLQQAMAIDAENLDIRFDLATALAALGQLQRAREELLQINRVRPDDQEVQRRLQAINTALEKQ